MLANLLAKPNPKAFRGVDATEDYDDDDTIVIGDDGSNQVSSVYLVEHAELSKGHSPRRIILQHSSFRRALSRMGLSSQDIQGNGTKTNIRRRLPRMVAVIVTVIIAIVVAVSLTSEREPISWPTPSTVPPASDAAPMSHQWR